MKKVTSFIADLIISLGLAFIIFVIIAKVLIGQFNNNTILNSFSILASISGLAVVIIGMSYTRRIHQMFIGLELFFWGIISYLMLEGYIPYTFAQWWPMIGVLSGVFLFISGIIKYKRIKFVYFFPAAILFFLGGWYLLFSLYIIQFPFRLVAIVGGPLFFIMTALFIIGFFLLQKKYPIPGEKNENDIDTDLSPESEN